MTSRAERLAQRASMVRTLDTTNEYTAQVPPKVRTIAYLTMLVLSALVALVTGIVAVWWPDVAPQVAATGSALLTAAGIVAGGLGVIYRPTIA